MDEQDIHKAANLADELNHRRAREAFKGSGLSEATIEELVKAHVMSPARLTDGEWTEASMQRLLTDAAFREVKEYRRHH
jgi:hypothetical protein